MLMSISTCCILICFFLLTFVFIIGNAWRWVGDGLSTGMQLLVCTLSPVNIRVDLGFG